MVGIILGSIFGGLVLLILIFALIFIIYIYSAVFKSPKKGQNNEYRLESVLDLKGNEEKFIELVKTMTSLPYESLYTTSYDGLKLHAYFYPKKDSNHYVLFFNGYRGIPRRDFAGKAIEIMKLNKNVILCNQRAHDKSEGHALTLGRKEQYDVVSWVKFVKEKFGKDVKITLYGISFGAATVLFAADKIDSDVSIIADSPYSSEKDLVTHFMKLKKVPPKIFWPLTYLAALLFCHARLKDDALNTVSNSKCRTLIIHGTDDKIVPFEMSERLYLPNKDHVQMAAFEGLDHALGFIFEKEKYMKIIADFLNQ